ncbi:MAG: transposase [Lewinellaceae bacterium]|nr:transposase [Lewinellaceae bacterium]
MTGTRESLGAMIGELAGTAAVRRRILQTIFPLLLTLPQRNNFKQLARWGNRNEGTLHNWYRKELHLDLFNRSLIDKYSTGDCFVIFDPSYLPKSGKRTPCLGPFWSGQAGAVKRGLELGAFAVGDLGHHTAFHLSASLTPTAKELAKQGKTLMGHYVDLVRQQEGQIQHFGNLLVCDGYFGVQTFVEPILQMDICLISCLRSNAALYYAPILQLNPHGSKKRGRPRKKGSKIDWNNLDEQCLPIVLSDAEKIVRSALVYVKCFKRQVRLVAVDYLREDGSLFTRKLYFCTDTQKEAIWVLEHYQCRFQIEFLFRDAKQFTGLTHCQSTNQTKMENHVNLALSAVSVAKAAHWLPLPKDQRGPFSMAELKNYYYNLALVERFSVALGLNPTETKNNPKIKELLFSSSYAAIAA